MWLILLPLLAIGLARLRFDVEVFDLLPPDLRAVQGLKIYQEHFANARDLLLTISAPGAEQAEAAARSIAERLRVETNLVAEVTWEPPWLEHPEQTAEFMAYLWLNQAPEAFRQLTNRLAPEKLQAVLADAREQLATSMSPPEIARLSYDPFGLTRLPEKVAGAAPSFGEGQEMFSSADGRFRIMFVQARPRLQTYRECDEWLRRIQAIVQGGMGPGQASGVSLGYTGRPAFVSEVALGMQHDITLSVVGTALIIACLFWLAHRRLKPMFWLLALLALILGSTLALGGLIFGRINVVSMGFAAILLGLAVDYAVIHYQEALAHPELSIPEIRRAIAPSIFWAAVTTISSFLVLNFGGLPGLGQLGTLVGLGVGLSACIMIFEFLPPLFPDRREPKSHAAAEAGTGGARRAERETWQAPTGPAFAETKPARVKVVFGLTAAVAVSAIAVLLWLGRPPIDPTGDALRPRNSPAYAAMDEIQKHLTKEREPVWLIVGGRTEAGVARRLDQVQAVLERSASNHLIAGVTLPTALWPSPEFQASNRSMALALAAERRTMDHAAQAEGFAPNSLALTDRILEVWQAVGRMPGVFWPTNKLSQWVFRTFAARTPTNMFALGLVAPMAGQSEASRSQLSLVEEALPREDVWLSGWGLLGSSIFSRVKANLWKVLGPMVCLVLLSLWLAFHRPREISLSLAALLLSGLALLTVMRLVGWSWNLLNLMAIPLVLGTGVDYSIFMQLALRRYNGDLRMAYLSVGRALLLCGGTAVVGFGSLAFSTNAGMASLGRVCSVGIGCNMLIAIFLVPVWWSGGAKPPQVPKA